MIVGSTGKEMEGQSQDLLITRCVIYTNGENGMTVLDFVKGTVTIESCKVYENYHNGLYFLQSKDSPGVSPPKPDQVAPQLDRGTIHVLNCEIMRNRQYGVTLSMIHCYFSDTTINENGDGAVSLDERSKQLVKFTNQSPEHVRNLVQGSIGGDWGSLYPEKRGLCGRSNCAIF